MERLTNITPIDEYYNDMTKDEVYESFFNTYQLLDLFWKQMDDLEFALNTVKKTKDTVKVDQVLDILEMQEKERIAVMNEHLREKEVVIVCKEKEN